ncbi:DNA replication ATP-dependent helicase/nuclease DNA2 [Anastrepha ludens]|uniref:DNA replication ATP-dependent helicase/nuclease DNA2 n=1 Tax=Anastrepha ludens TaxID=28586 RepID=UPI0023B00C7F|nr:DNA replication ATP-dependent helicase/nuclease DNA2 [Anastrepha ludens]
MSKLKRIVSPMKEQITTPTKKVKIGVNEFEANHTNLSEIFGADDDFEEIINAKQLSAKQNNPLDLSKWQRCVVVEAGRIPLTFDIVLQVCIALDQEEEYEKENSVGLTKCRLQQQWSQTKVNAGDIVSLLAAWNDELKSYIVNNEYGYIVVNPDILISSTSVVGSLFCRRKAVLQDRFKGIDANSKVMVIGSIVHEMLQLVLQKGLKSSKDIELAAGMLLNSPDTAYELYSNSMTRDELGFELEKFVPKVISFVEQYIEGNATTACLKENFQGTIDEIQDIEENVWAPQLGLKGRVDVTVRVKQRKHEMVSNVVPLELKTGRASFSMEHKGQVILYQMMLSAIGRETNSSLLLYLRECIMRELRGTRNEQRDLIMLRNDFAHYILCSSPMAAAGTPLAMPKDGKFVQPLKLPDPISHHSACGNCEYATICCTFAKTDPELQLRSGHPLKGVMQTVTDHLQAEDYKYFMHWCSLLALEEQEMRKSSNFRTLWTNTPEQRQEKGIAIIAMRLSAVSNEGSLYLHKLIFRLADENNQLDLLLSGFSIGEYVIISTSRRLAVGAGSIVDISSTHVTISLDLNLSKNYANETFIIDKHESQSGNAFNFTNVSLLLDNRDRAKILREIVVHRMPPTFQKNLPKIVATKGASILKELNKVQRSAVLKALTAESYMLIKGLPGTGKTQTLVAIVRLLHLMGKSVLVTSHTHSAVDNLLVRLKPHKIPMLRLGSGARINAELQEFGERILLTGCNTVETITEKYNSFSIVGVTCLGSSHPLFLHRKFDFCIVDEATQIMQPTTLRPVFYSDKFILVGDPDQLPPLIRSKEACRLGADESLFERLDTAAATSILTLQYRMNKAITRLANELTYNGALQCASKEVELNNFQLNLPNAFKVEKWVMRALQTHIDQSVFLLDTKDCSERLLEYAKGRQKGSLAAISDNITENDVEKECTKSPALSGQKIGKSKRISKYTNYCEAAIVMNMVELLLKTGYAPENIGVIAPYRAQVEYLRKLVSQFDGLHRDQPHTNFAAVEVNTVDQYQGRDKDIIFLSGTKTGAVKENECARDGEILEDKRRLTVAITRAKRKLILVGDAACLDKYTPFHTLLGHIPSYCKLELEDGKLGFEWQSLLNVLANIKD